ncbi:scavenger receptor class F member 1-like [Ruditapes philippinarum]|uniref:scavenger receptor class F member 1-like n=1 Tax=Ruditapes philippinarum TaxID=129788 RepID=UPI00295B0ABF|nr:scavenger receptor class F member 1-like [Ruditapes philippinarum]
MMVFLHLFVFVMFFGMIEVQDFGWVYGCRNRGGGGVTCSDCSDGFYNFRDGQYNRCKKCPPRCTACHNYNSAVNCVACTNPNRYGTDCSKNCSKGCLNSTCDKTSGACSCKDNYNGDLCDDCAEGKYEMASDCVMDCPQNCNRCISETNCTECKTGFFGNVCEFNCSRGCYLDKCSKSNGTCYQEKCKPNFDGINCTTCSPRFHGTYCQLPCPESCVACSRNTSCDDCQHGYWGTACQHNCSIGCYKSSCFKKTGVCMYSKCKTGFIGEKCDICVLGKHGMYCNITETLNGNGSSAMKFTGHSSKYAVMMMVMTLFRFIV